MKSSSLKKSKSYFQDSPQRHEEKDLASPINGMSPAEVYRYLLFGLKPGDPDPLPVPQKEVPPAPTPQESAPSVKKSDWTWSGRDLAVMAVSVFGSLICFVVLYFYLF